MNLKNCVYNIIESSKLLMKIYLRIFNKYSSSKNNILWRGIKIRKNTLFFEGKDNKLICGRSVSVQKNVIRCLGQENIINIGDFVEIIGDGTQNIFVKGNNNQIIVEKNAVMRNVSLFICGDNNRISISENYSGIDVEFHVEEDNGEISIGKNTSMHGRGWRNISFVLEEGTNIYVGEDCMIANNVQFRSSDSHSVIDMEGRRLNKAKDIIIGNHCWFGMGSYILKGTKISDCTVVAAGSICNKEYDENNVVLAGSPAKIVRREIDWKREKINGKAYR